jgi:hypothetical protein
MHGTSAKRGKPDMLLTRGKWVARRTDGIAGTGGGKKRMLVGNRPDSDWNIIARESEQTSLWSFGARAFDSPTQGGKADDNGND